MSDPLLGSELDAMVQRYLGELSGALGRLPASRRDHLVGEIREHIVELRAERPVRDRSDMEALLNRVGLPEDIAAVALEDLDEDEAFPVMAPPPPPLPMPSAWSLRRLRPGTLVGLAIGAVVLVVGIGVVGIGVVATRHGSVFGSSAVANPQRSFVPQPPRRLAPATVNVPNVIGMSEAQAAAALAAGDLRFASVSGPSSATPVGLVVSQDPAAGSSVAPGSSVTLQVSSGPSPPS